MLTRRVFCFASFVAGLAGPLRATEHPIKLRDLYNKDLSFSDLALQLEGQRIAVTGFMAPPLKIESKFFPGYVLLKVELTKQIYHLIKNLQKVSGFLGSSDKPTPISDKEIQRILGQVSESAINQTSGITFEIGEKVKVCDGPFASFNGLIEEIDEEKSRLKVSVSIFGRATPVDLEFNQVEKN